MNLKIIKKNMGILYMEFKNAKDNRGGSTCLNN